MKSRNASSSFDPTLDAILFPLSVFTTIITEAHNAAWQAFGAILVGLHVRKVLEAVHYRRWIRKIVLVALLGQLLTFLVAVIYYGFTTAGALDTEGPIMNWIITGFSLATGGTFVMLVSILGLWIRFTPNDSIDSKRRRATMLVVVTGLLVGMLLVSIMITAYAGHSPELAFAKDDEDDVILSADTTQEANGFVFASNLDTPAAPQISALIDGDVVDWDDLAVLDSMTNGSWLMFMFSLIGIATILHNGEAFVVPPRAVQFKEY